MALIYDPMGNIIGDDGDNTDPAPSSWGGENHDAAQRGEITSDNLTFIQRKVGDFQAALYSADETATMLRSLYDACDDVEMQIRIADQLDEFDNRKAAFRFAAEAFNAAASAVNAVGGSLPSVVIPSGLGLLPAIPLGYIAAIAAAGLLIDWAHNWITVSFNLATEAAKLITDPAKKDQVLADISHTAALQSGNSTVASVATAFKWVAIAAAVFMAYKAFTDSRA
jgi:hypothetical protein